MKHSVASNDAAILSRRIRSLDVSIMRKISEIALPYDVVPLNGGSPDFPAPEVVKDAASTAILADRNQYAPLQGLAELREAISKRYERNYQVKFDAEREIAICCGATESITAALLATIDPGDEVIILEPAFGLYAAAVILCGGQPIAVSLEPPDFSIERTALEQAISPKTKAIIINSPHNPSGRVFSTEELTIVAELCERYQLLAISDEVYDEILFDGTVAAKLWKIPGMRSRTIIVNSFSKTYVVTGWRLGYTLAPPAITQGILVAHNYLSVAAPTPLQIGGIAAVKLPNEYYRQLAALLQKRRDFLRDGLEKIGFRCINPQGGYFVLAECSAFSQQGDLAFAEYLIREVGVAAIPLSGFYRRKSQEKGIYLRFAFCKQEETLRKALTRLNQLITGNESRERRA